jgi:hypothetical protein
LEAFAFAPFPLYNFPFRPYLYPPDVLRTGIFPALQDSYDTIVIIPRQDHQSLFQSLDSAFDLKLWFSHLLAYPLLF